MDEIAVNYEIKLPINQSSSLQCWSEIIETNAKNGVVSDTTSNEQPI